MDIKKFNKASDLKQNLMNFCIQNIPKTEAEIELAIKFEYSDNFVDFIVEKAFTSANKIEDIPNIMENLIKERKNQLSKEVGLEQRDFPFIIDYDAKKGTLIRYNNRTLDKYFEKDAINNIVNHLRLEDKRIYNKMPGNDTLLHAAKYGHLDIIEEQFKQGGLTFHVFNNYMIDMAAKHGQIDVVEYLVERGARIQRAIVYGTEEVKDWAFKWKKRHPEKQRSFDISWKDYLSMMENNPDWIKNVSYEKASEMQNINPNASLEEKKNQVLLSIAIIRNVAGEDAVEKFKSKIIKKP